jgi:hypothetical protein
LLKTEEQIQGEMEAAQQQATAQQLVPQAGKTVGNIIEKQQAPQQ